MTSRAPLLRRLLGRLLGRAERVVDPVEAFDAELDLLAAEGAQLRRLLADLLLLRGQLRLRAPPPEEALLRLDEDALELKHELATLEARRARLREERQEFDALVAGARAAAAAESHALAARTRELLALDAARDEAERLAALRALYEEDRRRG